MYASKKKKIQIFETVTFETLGQRINFTQK